jgi:hypothetical protein
MDHRADGATFFKKMLHCVSTGLTSRADHQNRLRAHPSSLQGMVDVASVRGRISSVDLVMTISGRGVLYEDERAFVHESLRRRKADAACASSDEGNFSFKLAHYDSSLVIIFV